MRQGNNPRRGRNRAGRRPNVPSRSQNFDSNGPEGRIRGNASQVFEKYQALARDAQSSGDRILAEAFMQHAEHYFRVMNDSTDPQPLRPPREAAETEEQPLEVREAPSGQAEEQAPPPPEREPQSEPREAAPQSGPREGAPPRLRRPARLDGDGEAPSESGDGVGRPRPPAPAGESTEARALEDEQAGLRRTLKPRSRDTLGRPGKLKLDGRGDAEPAAGAPPASPPEARPPTAAEPAGDPPATVEAPPKPRRRRVAADTDGAAEKAPKPRRRRTAASEEPPSEDPSGNDSANA